VVSKRERDIGFDNDLRSGECIRVEVEPLSEDRIKELFKLPAHLKPQGAIVVRTPGGISIELVDIVDRLAVKQRFSPATFTLTIIDGSKKTIKATYPALLFAEVGSPGTEYGLAPIRTEDLSRFRIKEALTYLANPETIRKLIKAQAGIVAARPRPPSYGALLTAFLLGLLLGSLFLQPLLRSILFRLPILLRPGRKEFYAGYGETVAKLKRLAKILAIGAFIVTVVTAYGVSYYAIEVPVAKGYYDYLVFKPGAYAVIDATYNVTQYFKAAGLLVLSIKLNLTEIFENTTTITYELRIANTSTSDVAVKLPSDVYVKYARNVATKIDLIRVAAGLGRLLSVVVYLIAKRLEAE